jgi:membrane dipeptidase
MLPFIEKARDRALELLKPTQAQLDHGLELHRESLVVDSFGFAPLSLTRRMIERVNAMNDDGTPRDVLKNRLLEMRCTEHGLDPEARDHYAMAWDASGVTGTMQTSGGAGDVARVLRHFARFFYIWDQLPEVTFKATTSDDVRRAKAEGRHCQFISMNGLPGVTEDLDASLDMVDTFYHLGCRMMHLTYNLRNVIGDGCTEPANAGLSDFGRDVVTRMNEVGILVDTPHSGKQTTLDAARHSRAPMAASHTVCDGVFKHDRGKSDEEIKAIVDTGGFVGICCIPGFLGKKPNIIGLLDHIDYLVKLVGAGHAAIGTDVACHPPEPEDCPFKPFSGPQPKNRNWSAEHMKQMQAAGEEHLTGSLLWTNWPYFTVGLVQRGYSDDDIRKIIGGNVLRVLDDVRDRSTKWAENST